MDAEIHQKLQRIVDQVLFLEKRNILQFEDTKLFPTEIHLLLLVSQGGEMARNATRIAEHLGVTKGAVSQTLSRLEKKGILRKVTDPQMKNELILSLTRAGQRALELCLALKGRLEEHHEQLLRSFTRHDKEVILRFLSRLERLLAERLK